MKILRPQGRIFNLKFKFLTNRNCTSKELESMSMYTDEIQNKIIKARIKHILEWYIRKADFYKRIFYFFSVAAIVVNACVPIMNQMQSKTKWDGYLVIATTLSGIATVLISMVTLFTMKDTWFRYRKHAELIKKECIMHAVKKKDYNGEDRDGVLIENVEAIIDDERMTWETSKFSKKEDKDKN